MVYAPAAAPASSVPVRPSSVTVVEDGPRVTVPMRFVQVPRSTDRSSEPFFTYTGTGSGAASGAAHQPFSGSGPWPVYQACQPVSSSQLSIAGESSTSVKYSCVSSRYPVCTIVLAKYIRSPRVCTAIIVCLMPSSCMSRSRHTSVRSPCTCFMPACTLLVRKPSSTLARLGTVMPYAGAKSRKASAMPLVYASSKLMAPARVTPERRMNASSACACWSSGGTCAPRRRRGAPSAASAAVGRVGRRRPRRPCRPPAASGLKAGAARGAPSC